MMRQHYQLSAVNRMLPISSLLLLLLLYGLGGHEAGGSGAMRGPHHPRGHYHHQPRHDTKLTQDTELLRDVHHIEEDLGNWGMSKEALHKLTPEELDFHYFKLHDFDNNTKLDGLEILKAISHTVHEAHPSEDQEGSADGGPREKSEVNTPEDDLPYFVELIDQVLAEDDKDNDGYLSYMEYVIGRQRDDRGGVGGQDIRRHGHHNHG